jgi:NitT/TauT family transport system substrate-binding protein
MKTNHLILLLLIFTVTISCTPKVDSPSDSSSQPITLPVGYIPNIQFAPLYAAIENGFYQEENLEVSLDYSMESDNVALVGANKIPFAIVSGEQVLLGRAQGLPIVYVLAWYQEYPIGIVAKSSQNIQHPSDLAGKEIGFPGQFGASYIGLRALLEAGNLEEKDVILNVVGFNQVEVLATDQQDAVVVYITNEPIQLRAQGYDISVLRVSDHLQLISNGLITNETTIRDNPELVANMVRATLRGINFTIDDPKAAYSISEKYIEGLADSDTDTQMQILMESISHYQTDQMGYSDPTAWQNMQNILLRMELLSQPIEIESAYSNQYLPTE